jgi:hypothetical protein
MPLFSEVVMNRYYPSLLAIEQQTQNLHHHSCHHCKQTNHLLSHGYVFKKKRGADPSPVGKRVFCSNRNHHTGCGRTHQLYLDSRVPALFYSLPILIIFLLAFIHGTPVLQAYQQATGSSSSRHAYRWLLKFQRRLSDYRAWVHQPLIHEPLPSSSCTQAERRMLFASTFERLFTQWGDSLGAAYQKQFQQPFC